ncbi:phage tail domain-containing protein [Streptomyces regalis]|uniref:Phage tail protein n=1 Tax=Streptomyces regalis TaxID=68262 RepID=A0A101JAI5_9ACTN|nr:phage tail domain-containing protein [Streptomyces regalis]KUL23228.1 hypothetical protein ADL12_39820 [Streptomyces regalis]
MSTAELKDFQLDFGGIVLGHDTAIPIAEIEGLGRPGTRGELVEQPGADGAWAAPDWYEARTLRIDCAIKTPGDPAAARQVLADLETIADNRKIRTVGGAVMPLRIKWPGSPVRVLYGRLSKLEPSWEKAAFGWVPLDVEFVAPDPRYYADFEQGTQLRLGWLSGGGFTAPVQAPIRVTSGSPNGQNRPGWVTNGGAIDAHPVITVHGPCANPVITHVGTGRSVDLPVTLAAGQWIRIDTRPSRISVTRENGGTAPTTSRLDTFVLPPGRSEIRWTASDPTATARLTVAWRDAYIAL